MKKSLDTALAQSADYRQFIEELKERVSTASFSAARRLNQEMISLYWEIGQSIAEKQQALGWGDAAVEMVAADLRNAFPESRSFSADNVWRMRQFFLAYSAPDFLGQAVPEMALGGPKERGANFLGQAVPETPTDRESALPAPFNSILKLALEVPWGHNLVILKKLTDPAARLWYLGATSQYGWSRAVLLNQIKAGAYERAAKEKKTHNFALALPEDFAEQAEEMLKSSYSLDFLGLRKAVKERELEDRLITRLQQFLLELGYGFCFVGRQYRVKVGNKEYSIDLLFYHRFLKALVAFDLKVIAFEPEHAGKMDFYLNVLNDQERGPDDQPSIGIILCAERDDVEVEYALKSKTNPIGVAVYELQSTLPSELKGKLPTAKQLADVVRAELEDGK